MELCRIKVDGGYIVVEHIKGESALETNVEGINIRFETDNGDVMDISCAEIFDDHTNIYSHKNIYTDLYRDENSFFYEDINNLFN